MAATGDTAVVLLKSSKDWTRWIALIKTKAVNNDIWRHIDPSVPSPPAFEPPNKPLPSQFATAGSTDVTAASLTTAQFQRYNTEVSIWQEELKDHRKKVKVITEIEDHVIRTAGIYWSTIESVTGLHARLVKLKERVAPSTYAREQEVTRRYEQVRTQAKSTRTEEWLAEWESALRDAIELHLPDVQDTRPTRHFLQAVEKIAPLFAQTWFNTIETKAVMTPDVQLNTVIPDGFQIAQIFRNQANMITRDATAAFSTPTFQGKEAESYGKTDQTCFEGYGRHTLDSCFYLRKDLRPDGWKMDIEKVRLLLRGLKKSPDLQERHQEAIKEMEDFLDGSKKEDTPSPEAQSNSIIGKA
jgi:hypothetical protein